MPFADTIGYMNVLHTLLVTQPRSGMKEVEDWHRKAHICAQSDGKTRLRHYYPHTCFLQTLGWRLCFLWPVSVWVYCACGIVHNFPFVCSSFFFRIISSSQTTHTPTLIQLSYTAFHGSASSSKHLWLRVCLLLIGLAGHAQGSSNWICRHTLGLSFPLSFPQYSGVLVESFCTWPEDWPRIAN
jgi:hypothetical protein